MLLRGRSTPRSAAAASHRVLIAVAGGLESAPRSRSVVVRRVGGEEDGRYRELRARWRERGREQTRFFVFYQAQGLLASSSSAPFLLAASTSTRRLEPLEWAGAALWLVAAGGEALGRPAARALQGRPGEQAARRCATGSGATRAIRTTSSSGSTWVAFALIALAGAVGLDRAGSRPALMLYLILFVTGIPPTEEQALGSRGDDYRRYQRETSPFVPWFRARSARDQTRRPVATARHPRQLRPPAAPRAAARPRGRAASASSSACAARRSPSTWRSRTSSTTRCPPSFFQLVLGPRLKY